MKGGDKEGQGPRSNLRKEKDEPKKDTANVAGEEGDGVWMVIASDSSDEHTVGNDKFNEFNDFKVSDKDLYIFKEYKNKNEVSNLTTQFK